MAKVVVFFKFADGDTIQAIVEGKTSYPDALAHLNHSAKRIPRHYVERKASIHAVIDTLLTNWQQAGPNCRTCGRTKAMCDAEPRHCCPVCDANGHGD